MIIWRFKGVFEKIDFGNYRYYFTDNRRVDIEIINRSKEVNLYMDGKDAGKDRVVYLNSDCDLIVKKNRFRNFRRSLASRLSLNFNRSSLKEEFENLIRLERFGVAPTPYYYARDRNFFYRNEKIAVEYFYGSETVLRKIERDGAQIEIFEKVFELFKVGLNCGFVHLDPHASNIVIVNDSYKFIDFEACYFGDVGSVKYYSYMLGFFYKEMKELLAGCAVYDAAVSEFVSINISKEDSEDFFSKYKYFKSKELSKKDKFALFRGDRLTL